MKTLNLFIMMIFFTTLLSCRKNDFQSTTNLSVNRYIELLKANQYDSVSIPSFTYQDIPALLTYRNETQLISNFPRNPISSFYGRDCKLGIYI